MIPGESKGGGGGDVNAVAHVDLSTGVVQESWLSHIFHGQWELWCLVYIVARFKLCTTYPTLA